MKRIPVLLIAALSLPAGAGRAAEYLQKAIALQPNNAD